MSYSQVKFLRHRSDIGENEKIAYHRGETFIEIKRKKNFHSKKENKMTIINAKFDDFMSTFNVNERRL